MGSSPNKGYLVPDNPTPDGLNCLIVFYPDDPFYHAALIGSLSFLGTWVAWEKDGTTRAKQAAEAWKEANEATMSNCLDNLVTALSGIQTAIENNTPVCAPVINVDACCGGGGEYPSVPPIPPDEDGIDPPPSTIIYDPINDPTPPDGYDDWQAYLTAKCTGANYIADKVIDLAANFALLGSFLSVLSIQNILVQLSMIIPGAWLLALGGWVLTNLAINLLNISQDEGLGVFGQFSDALEASKEELVCSIYSWLSVEDALGTVHNFIQSIIDPLPISASSKTLLSAFWLAMLSSRFFNWYATNLEALVPDGYIGTVDCSSCGCGLYRNLIYGTGDLTGLGERELVSEYNDDLGNYSIEFELDGNHCVKFNSQVSTSSVYWTCENGELVEQVGAVQPDTVVCLAKLRLNYGGVQFSAMVDIIEPNPDCECVSTCLDLSDCGVNLVPSNGVTIINGSGSGSGWYVDLDWSVQGNIFYYDVVFSGSTPSTTPRITIEFDFTGTLIAGLAKINAEAFGITASSARVNDRYISDTGNYYLVAAVNQAPLACVQSKLIQTGETYYIESVNNTVFEIRINRPTGGETRVTGSIEFCFMLA